MNLYKNWQNQLDILHKVYSKICIADEIKYTKDVCATENEVVELEQKLLVSIPKSLRDLFLGFSKSIVFKAFLPDDFSLPQNLKEIFSAYFVIDIDEMLQAEEDRQGWIENCFNNPDNEYDKVWYNKLGFMTVGNGDVIAFDLNDEKDDKRVVYLSHDEGEGHGVVLGETFEKYFKNLILIGGCGNEDWQMIPFIDEEKGLCANSENAKIYRQLIGLLW